MTKKDIVIELSKKFGLTQIDTKKIVQGTLEAIIEVIAEDGRIELRNFGVFEVKKRARRQARNPKTGQPVEVPEKWVVVFKPGREMTEKVNAISAAKAAGQPSPPPAGQPANQPAGQIAGSSGQMIG